MKRFRLVKMVRNLISLLKYRRGFNIKLKFKDDKRQVGEKMAELNLKQIIDKLNNEFTSDVRKLVFWYDDNAEFVPDIDTLELENAKILKLESDNQFRTKYFLEREDTQTNYLIYAPFPKPVLKDNHLADTIRYSKEFFADRASLLAMDLGIDEKYKPVLQHYIKFFEIGRAHV